MADFKRKFTFASRNVYRIGKGLSGIGAVVAAVSGLSASDISSYSNKLLGQPMTIETEQHESAKTKTENPAHSTNEHLIIKNEKANNKSNNAEPKNNTNNNNINNTSNLEATIPSTPLSNQMLTPTNQGKPANNQPIKVEYKQFANSNIGYSFEYPANAQISSPGEYGLSCKLTNVVRVSIGISNQDLDIWSNDIKKNISELRRISHRYFKLTILDLQQLSENSVLVYGKDNSGRNYIEKSFFIFNSTEGRVIRCSMSIYCNADSYDLNADPKVKAIVQHMLDSFKLL